jgi:hypothetical protein
VKIGFRKGGNGWLWWHRAALLYGSSRHKQCDMLADWRLYPFAEKTSKEKLYDQGNERLGSAKDWKDRMLYSNVSFQRTLSSMDVFRRLVPSFSAHVSTNLAALPQTPSLCFNILACTLSQGHTPIPIPNRRYAINPTQIISFTG